MIQYSRVCLHTIDYQLPPRVLTSEEIEEQLAPLYERLHLPVGRLALMSGISERRLWPSGTTPSQAASFAGQKVIDRAGIDPRSIECLIFTSVSRDMIEPATASFVHKSLGISNRALVFDISNACLGFLNGIVMLANMIELGQVNNGLIVSGETAETLLQSTLEHLVTDNTLTRKGIKPAFASLTIGSGAVALYMQRCQPGDKCIRLAHGAWSADTGHVDLCQGGQKENNAILMATDSEELLHRGVETAKATWQLFSSRIGWHAADIGCFFCHQVGSAHAKLLFETLGLSQECNFQTLSFLGNVGSVSAPITMAIAIEQGRFHAGQKGALLGIGSGINCMMLGVEW